MKPSAAVSLICCGQGAIHSQFCMGDVSIYSLYRLYMALTVSLAKVVDILEAVPMNPNEARVFDYLKQFVGNMNHNMVRRFMHFTTGSSDCLTKTIAVQFNSLSGFARRPTTHTCDCVLDLPSTYYTYPDFVMEFEGVLSQPEICMDNGCHLVIHLTAFPWQPVHFLLVFT